MKTILEIILTALTLALASAIVLACLQSKPKKRHAHIISKGTVVFCGDVTILDNGDVVNDE